MLKRNKIEFCKSSASLLKTFRFFLFMAILLLSFNSSYAQFKKIHLENTENDISKISLYSSTEGYVAFNSFIGYTTDGGQNFDARPITNSNVNFNGYAANLTFGFETLGVKAFDKNKIIVYGDYALVPAILYSSDGGSTYKLVYHSQLNLVPNSRITDMVFPSNGSIGYAVDADRILKTIDGGLTWNVSQTYPNTHFTNLQALSDNQVYAFSNYAGTTFLYSTSNGGGTWQQIQTPSATNLQYVYFLTTSKGWSNTNDGSFYTTTNGGVSWTLQNNVTVAPFTCSKMTFVNDSTGYALSGYEVYKTTNNGKIWERLKRDNNYTYLGYSLSDIQISGSNIWAGGGHGYLEMSSNSGGTTIPKALFAIDTAGYSVSGNVKLVNYSRSGNNYQWLVNGKVVGTTYNATYAHDIFSLTDVAQLIVSNSVPYADTASHTAYFNPPVLVSGFTPDNGSIGTKITITGINFTNVTDVRFGGVSAASFVVNSPTSITAVLGKDASGKVQVITALGNGSKDGFTFVPAPVVSSFLPLSAVAGTAITINGSNFANITAVRFGGVPAASFTLISPTQISAVLGPGSSGYVSVAAKAGSDSLAGFKIIPVMTSFTPTSGTFGTVLHISGTGFGGATAVSVAGIAVQSFTVDSIKGISAVISAGKSGSVSITTPAGSSALSGFTYYNPPKITSFAPSSGPVGTTVIITGTNFSTVPSENIVYFGVVKATVSAATATTLTVTVPVETTNQVITVVTHHLIAYSSSTFTVTFPNGGSITPKSFTAAKTLTISDPQLLTRVFGDIDGDGKVDIVIVGANNKIIFYRNVSTGKGDFSYQETDISTPNTSLDNILLADLDGDGKLDIIGMNFIYDNISVVMNKSVPGSIAFAAPVSLDTKGYCTTVWVQDFDGDGKADIAFTTFPGPTVSIFRNKSEPGSFAFYPKVDFNLGGGDGSTVAVGDLNGDGLPDMVSLQNNQLTTSLNSSTPGNISFLYSQGVDANTTGGAVEIADLDGDGKPELILLNSAQNAMYIYKNLSPKDWITFDKKKQFYTSDVPRSIAVNDLDGDGKPDITINSSNNFISVFKNIGTPGNIALSARVDYTTANPAVGVLQACDLDGDGKTDIAIVSGNNSIQIFQNNVQASPFVESFTPSHGIAGTPVTITGLNFAGASGVSFGGVAASSFKVNADQTITAVVGTGASGDIMVTNSFDTSTIPGFAYGQPPIITSFAPQSGIAGTAVTITGDHFDPVAANNIVYFGRVRGVVSSATSSKLVVTVPDRITYDPISVTTNKFIAYTDRPFTLTFPNGDASFTTKSFADKFNMLGGGNGIIGDLDGDGKLDMVFPTGYGTQNLSVARNTSTNNTLSFAPVQTFGNGTNALRLYLADIDGDGKLDLVTLNMNPASVTIFINNSTLGNISFAPGISFSSTISSNYFTGISAIAITDMDGDGKPDIATANYGSQTVSLYLNQTVNGKLAFGQRVDYSVDSYAQDVVLRDMDGDGKPDVMVTTIGVSTLDFFKNISSPGAITLADKVTFTMDGDPGQAKVADIDGDGKLDILVANVSTGNISTFRNTTSGGVLSFAQSTLSKGPQPLNTAIADLNGDGKPDFIYNDYNSLLAICQNTSAVNTIQLSDPYYFSGYGGLTEVGDMDGDGKPDLVQFQSNVINILMNKDTVRFQLPANNFNVQFIGTSCKGSNDGSVVVTASTSLPYTATVTGTGFNAVKTFNSSITIGNLVPGNYSMCITIAGHPDYHQCYTFSIVEPKDLSVYATVNQTDNTVLIKMDGGTNYVVNLNGTDYKTSASELTLALQKGNNELQVTTDKLCQGLISKRITLSNGIVFYPNPFSDGVTIDVGESQAKTAKVSIVNIYGKTVYNATLPNNYGKVKADLSALDNGEYVVKLELDNVQSVFKILKQ